MKRLSSFVTIVLLLLAIIAGSLCKQWLTAENQKVQSNAGVSNTEGNSPASASSLAPHMYLTIPRTDIQGGVGISEEEGELWLESGCGPESTNIVIYGSTGEDGIFTQLWRWTMLSLLWSIRLFVSNISKKLWNMKFFQLDLHWRNLAFQIRRRTSLYNSLIRPLTEVQSIMALMQRRGTFY